MKRTKQFVILLLTLLFFAGGGEMKAESATAAFTGTEGTNVGKTLPFDYEFTASGSSITLTISNVNGTGIAELDTTPYIYEWTTGSQEGRGKAMTYTWNDFVPTTPLRVQLHWQAENGDFISDYLIYPENLTSRKTVYPLGGLKPFRPEDAVTEDNLQKITQDGNTDNVFLFPENGANLDYNKTQGIQGFYIDLGESKSIGAIQSTWEGADCGANIYLTNTEPADGSLTGETLIATFDNAQESAKNVTVTVENSGRYIVFVPTTATNYDWGVKIRTFAAFERQSSVLTSFVVNPSYVEKGVATELTLSPKDQYGMVLSNGVSYTASSGTLEGNSFTANSTGNVTITATYGGVSKTAIIYVVQKPVVSAEAVNVSSKTATINYWLPTASNTEINEDEIIFTLKQGTEVVSEATHHKNSVVGEDNKQTFVLESLQPSTTYTYTVTATHRASGLSSETSVQFTTEKERLTIWYKAGESDTEHGPYEGWTGELEKLITATDKGKQVLTKVTDLRIEGSLNNEDVKLLRRMAGGSTYVGETNVKKRVLIKAENDPYVYAWVGGGSDPVQELLGELPGTLITKKTDGYYEVEFTNTETVKIRINSQTTEFTLAEGNNYFTYDGTTYTQVVENNSYGILATLDLKEASFYHDGGVYMVAIENNNNNPISLELEYGAVVTKADIGNSMFRECSQLKNVILPDDCKIVGERAFYGGKVDDDISLESVTFQPGLERIEGYAFEKNEKLGEVTLPSSLTFIGYDAFRDCKAMTLGNENGQLPDNITTIRDWGFAGTSITEVILPHNAEYTKVEDSVFGWTKLKKVTIPNNVTTLVSSSFSTNHELEEIVFENNTNNITEIGDGAFWSNTKLPSEHINRLIENLTVLNNNVFNSCLALETLDIPARVATLKDLTFANCTNLRRVTVNSATAPSGYTVTEGKMQNAEGNTTDPFAAVNANHMTLTFAGAAQGGYKSYRGGSEATVENNPFRRLLTKTLDEEKKSYDVAGQMHADVVLKRTMVEGWNTVALPFGVKADSNRDRDFTAAGVYQKAFNGDVAENNNFMIAAYRGIEKDVFKFLKYSSYTTDPLDEFEPLLIRMGSGNISDNNEYTFVDVDLNYDFEENKLYRDGNAAGEVPVKRWDTESNSFKPFIGSNYDHEKDWFIKTTADFAFTGTYFTKTTKDNVAGYTYKTAGDYFIQPGDYIIQSNLFYETLDTKQYRLKGYRAWFQKQPNTTGARPAQLDRQLRCRRQRR